MSFNPTPGPYRSGSLWNARYHNGNPTHSYYGAFYSTITQSGSANVTNTIQFNATQYAYGITVQNSTRLTVPDSGLYSVHFSGQVQDDVNENLSATVWLSYTGSAMSYSGREFSLYKQSNSLSRAVISWNWDVLYIHGGDYIELHWSTPNTAFQLHATGSFPGIPSAEVSIFQVW